MKKLMIISILAMLLVLGVIAASADGPKAAIVIKDETCWVPDASGSFEFEDLYEVPECCKSVITNSQRNVMKFSCQAQLPPEAEFPESAMLLNYKNSGFECWWAEGGPFTQNYQFTITPSGKVNFYCVFKD